MTPESSRLSVEQGARRRPRRRRSTLSAQSGALLAPFAAVFVLFLLIPIVYAIVESFRGQHSSGLGFGPSSVRFVGFHNYVATFTDRDFLSGIKRLALFGVINIPLTIGLAVVFALILDVPALRARNFFRIVYFLPYAVPGVIGGILWAFLYQPQSSPYSRLLGHAGFTGVNLLSPNVVIWSIANIVIWGFAGYNMLILTAALNAIPQEQFEAARLDGCGRLREALYIKLPQLRPALVMTVLFAIIGTLQLFNEPLVLSLITKSVTTTYTPNLMAYSEAFSADNSYFASAISVILAAITAICSFVFLTVVNRRRAAL